MKPFLRQIAEAYMAQRRDSLIDTCFVFPNKRCSAFFTDYLAELSDGQMLLPAMTTIDELVCDMIETVVESRTELLFDLYECYNRIVSRRSTEVDNSFDTFLPWGEMVLNDFDDLDRYCVNASEMLRNISNFKEIVANYLTDEQVDVINRYWNDPVTYVDELHLWRMKNPDDRSADGVKSFFSLWMILDELYTMFRARLKRKGAAYSGMAYRAAAEMTDTLPADAAEFKRYVFVGFNALSKSEEIILKWFKDNKLADFYWDWELYTPKELEGINPAGDFVEHYKRMFPRDPEITYDFEAYRPESLPEITVIGVPSKIGQVKEAARILSDMIAAKPEDFIGKKGCETAVVLPEENLSLPMLDSFPEGRCKFNVTMGYPMRYTTVASLIKNIERMVTDSRLLHGKPTYYFKDIISVVTHPLIHDNFTQTADAIVAEINNYHVFNFSREKLIEKYPDMEPVFPLRATSDTEALQGIRSLLQMLLSITEKNSLDHTFVLQYLKSLENLSGVIANHNVPLSRSTIVHLLTQLTDGESVNFEGKPLDGVQMMGVLETRALDFDNLFILSMNDGIFPRITMQNSFIPNGMRATYGMSTIERHEAVFAYYFYRLISRAGKVWLIYDSRSGNSTDVSRYITQLKYLLRPAKMKFVSKTYQIKPSEKREIVMPKVVDSKGIVKDNRIMEKINRFRDTENPLYLSPTSIIRYLQCPLGFFLEYIADYREPDEIKDYIDASKWGTIVHQVMEKLYTRLSEQNNVITPDVLKQLLDKQKSLIEEEVVRAYMTVYLKQELTESVPLRFSSLSGANYLLANMIYKVVCKIIERESESEFFGNFRFIEGEQKFMESITLSPDLSVNIKGSIDRVDKTFTPDGEEVIKLIDYKTGKADTGFTSVETLFDNLDKKAIIQLMLYCNGYAAKHNYKGIIKPLVYTIKNILKKSLDHIKSTEDKQIDDYRTINDRFLKEFEKKIAPLFDPDVPFTQATDEKACAYCRFTGICDRKPRKF